MNRQRNLLIAMVWCVACASTMLQARRDMFQRGVDLYERGKYQDALTSFSSVDSQDASVLYNRGACYYHLHNHDQALLFWLRALRIASMSSIKKVFNALSLISYVPRWPLVIGAWMHALLPLIVLQSMWFVLWGMVLVLLLRGRRMKKIVILWGLVSCVLGVRMWFYTKRYGLVMHREVVVHGGPGRDYGSVGGLNHRELVAIVGDHGAWYKIKHPRAGWVSSDDVQAL